MPESPNPTHPIPSRLLRSILILRGLIGFMVGLFLFVFGPIVYRSFEAVGATRGGSDSVETLLGMSPLKWTGLLYAFSFVLDILLDVPTGLTADKFGRKTALVLSMLFRALSF